MQLTKDKIDALAEQHRVPGHATMIDHRAFAAAVIAEHTAKVLEDVEPVAWLDTVIDWTATGQPITRRICIQAQCGDWALSYIESALRETASTVAALKAEIEALRKDAERYRWLRDGEIVADYPYPVMRMGGSRVDDQTIWADELDAAIDRAACCDGTEGG